MVAMAAMVVMVAGGDGSDERINLGVEHSAHGAPP